MKLKLQTLKTDLQKNCDSGSNGCCVQTLVLATLTNGRKSKPGGSDKLKKWLGVGGYPLAMA